MKRNRLYIFIAILTSILLLSFSAICSQCTAPEGEKINIDNEEEVKEETPEKEEEGKELKESEEVSEEVEEEEEETEKVSEEVEGKSSPTLKLEVYEGPLYSESDEVCYWRVKAILTGNPTPEVEFSKDDSEGAWGKYKVQINLNNTSETYKLTATATNSEGTDSDSLNLSWECEEEPSGGEAGGDGDEEDGLVFEIMESSEMTFQPFSIGYVVYPTGVNTTELIIGDSISNTDVRGFFAFDLIALSGKEILSANLRLNTYKYYPDPSFKGRVIIVNSNYMPPLDVDYYFSLPPVLEETGFVFPNTANPIILSDQILENYIQGKVDSSCIAGFTILYEFSNTDWDYEIDGREFSKESISLRIKYVD